MFNADRNVGCFRCLSTRIDEFWLKVPIQPLQCIVSKRNFWWEQVFNTEFPVKSDGYMHTRICTKWRWEGVVKEVRKFFDDKLASCTFEWEMDGDRSWGKEPTRSTGRHWQQTLATLAALLASTMKHCTDNTSSIQLQCSALKWIVERCNVE